MSEAYPLGSAHLSPATTEAYPSPDIPVQALLVARTAIEYDLSWPHDPRDIGDKYAPYVEHIDQALGVNRADVARPRQFFSLIREGHTRRAILDLMRIEDMQYTRLAEDIPRFVQGAIIRHLIPDVRGARSPLKAALLGCGIRNVESSILEAYSLGLTSEHINEMFGLGKQRGAKAYDPGYLLRRHLPRLQADLGEASPLLNGFPKDSLMGKMAAKGAAAPGPEKSKPPEPPRRPALRLVTSAGQQPVEARTVAKQRPVAPKPPAAKKATPSPDPAKPPRAQAKPAPKKTAAVVPAKKTPKEPETIIPKRVQAELLRPEDEVELGQKIQRGKRAKACLETADPKATSIMFEDKMVPRATLKAEVASGNTAFWRFAQANEALVRWSVRSLHRHEFDSLPVEVTDDVLNEAIAEICSDDKNGLLRAVNDFDPSKGLKFSTYASAWMRRSVQLYVARNQPIPINKYAHLKVKELRRMNADPDYHAKNSDTTFSDSIRALHGTTYQSLQEYVGVDEENYELRGDLEPDAQSLQAEADVDFHLTLTAALNRLTDVQRAIVINHLGLDGSRPKHQYRLAAELDITQKQMPVERNAALEIMRAAFADWHD